MPTRPAEPEFPLSLKPLTRHSAELRAKILSMLRKGQSPHAIARERKIRLGTVGYHVNRLRAAGQFT